MIVYWSSCMKKLCRSLDLLVLALSHPHTPSFLLMKASRPLTSCCCLFIGSSTARPSSIPTTASLLLLLLRVSPATDILRPIPPQQRKLFPVPLARPVANQQYNPNDKEERRHTPSYHAPDQTPVDAAIAAGTATAGAAPRRRGSFGCCG